MDPLTILGAASAAGQLAAQGLELGNGLRILVKTIKNADREAKALVETIESTAATLRQFQENLEKEKQLKIARQDFLKVLDRLFYRGTLTFEKLQVALQTANPGILDDNVNIEDFVTRKRDRLAWPYSSRDIKVAQKELHEVNLELYIKAEMLIQAHELEANRKADLQRKKDRRRKEKEHQYNIQSLQMDLRQVQMQHRQLQMRLRHAQDIKDFDGYPTDATDDYMSASRIEQNMAQNKRHLSHIEKPLKGRIQAEPEELSPVSIEPKSRDFALSVRTDSFTDTVGETANNTASDEKRKAVETNGGIIPAASTNGEVQEIKHKLQESADSNDLSSEMPNQLETKQQDGIKSIKTTTEDVDENKPTPNSTSRIKSPPSDDPASVANLNNNRVSKNQQQIPPSNGDSTSRDRSGTPAQPEINQQDVENTGNSVDQTNEATEGTETRQVPTAAVNESLTTEPPVIPITQRLTRLRAFTLLLEDGDWERHDLSISTDDIQKVVDDFKLKKKSVWERWHRLPLGAVVTLESFLRKEDDILGQWVVIAMTIQPKRSRGKHVGCIQVVCRQDPKPNAEDIPAHRLPRTANRNSNGPVNLRTIQERFPLKEGADQMMSRITPIPMLQPSKTSAAVGATQATAKDRPMLKDKPLTKEKQQKAPWESLEVRGKPPAQPQGPRPETSNDPSPPYAGQQQRRNIDTYFAERKLQKQQTYQSSASLSPPPPNPRQRRRQDPPSDNQMWSSIPNRHAEPLEQRSYTIDVDAHEDLYEEPSGSREYNVERREPLMRRSKRTGKITLMNVARTQASPQPVYDPRPAMLQMMSQIAASYAWPLASQQYPMGIGQMPFSPVPSRQNIPYPALPPPDQGQFSYVERPDYQSVGFVDSQVQDIRQYDPRSVSVAPHMGPHLDIRRKSRSLSRERRERLEHGDRKKGNRIARNNPGGLRPPSPDQRSESELSMVSDVSLPKVQPETARMLKKYMNIDFEMDDEAEDSTDDMFKSKENGKQRMEDDTDLKPELDGLDTEERETDGLS